MSYRHLTESERTVIFYLNMDNRSQAEIARKLGRHPTTIGRELRRNLNVMDQYLPDIAQRKAQQRRQQPRQRTCTDDTLLMDYVTGRLEQHWSPEQTAGRLDVDPPDHLAGRTISHTTIYRWIWSDPGRAKRFKPFLRVAYKARRKPYGKPSKRGQIPNRVSIEDRPDVVETRRRLGDWEGDTVVGCGRSGYVLTGVDRRSRFTVAAKMHRRTAQKTSAAFSRLLGSLPATHLCTLTVDNGTEFAGHEAIAKRVGLAVYFAHPYSSWERGTNENTNGLLRQYLPKKRSFAKLTDAELQTYVRALNNRPRKCLNYQTPAEVFWKSQPLHL